MAWSWSHTSEAYDNASANLLALDHATLVEIVTEWDAYRPDAEDADSEGFSIEAHTAAHAADAYRDMCSDSIADLIWDRMSEQATCDNGGFNAWACPYGCHTVSFDRAE